MRALNRRKQKSPTFREKAGLSGRGNVCPSIEKRPGSVEAALEIIGDKWTGLLVGQLVGEPRTFSELEDCLPKMSPRTLSQRITMLLEKGIITRTAYVKKPIRYRYALTKKGAELRDILVEMAEWGEKYQ
jgi:DNA-binding HxlR family transcriptional regulator